MFGLDTWIAGFSNGASLGVVAAVAVLLGVRHASDPDHLAAVSTLIAGDRERAARAAARLGLAWGLGHGTSLFVFGLPIVVFNRYLPERLQQGAETLIGFLIVYLALRLIVRWHRGELHVHEHRHDEVLHVHLHDHTADAEHLHPHRPRSPIGAYVIGLAHGMGGSAGVSVLLLASIQNRWVATLALVVLAFFTALSMTVLTAGFGATLVSSPIGGAFERLAPALGAISLAFGIWYAGAAWSLMPYPF
jgi:ABC-type nickel/cobalt efflux system permease component RcnA